MYSTLSLHPHADVRSDLIDSQQICKKIVKGYLGFSDAKQHCWMRQKRRKSINRLSARVSSQSLTKYAIHETLFLPRVSIGSDGF